ncbi:MAG: hypothetical protein SOR61_07795 [Evtepia sp.]|uniref:hypothetical protein n=1 Tax=Evtepia sp. TaxID=2773933 RepID=UPI002A75F50C|nr:hypothetical protein [Evtepia sp.]MDY3015065.1 hypothetical protein [Evtepia sp.]
MNSNKPFAPQRRIAFAITVLGVAAMIVKFKDYAEAGPEAPIFWVMLALIVGIILLSTLLYCKLSALPPRAQKAMRGYLASIIIFGAIELAGHIIKVGNLVDRFSSAADILLPAGWVSLLSAVGCYFFLTGKALYPSDPGPQGW